MKITDLKEKVSIKGSPVFSSDFNCGSSQFNCRPITMLKAYS